MPDFYFEDQDGRRSTEYGILLEAYPTIKTGQPQKDSVMIPGRGTLYLDTGTYSDTVITLQIGMMDRNLKSLDISIPDYAVNENISGLYFDVLEYLSAMKEISFCDKPDYYYIVKNVELSATAQDSDVSMDFTVTLTCEPGAYLVLGKREHEVPEVLQNRYNVAHPVYKITGEGNCTLTINRNIVTANVAQNLTIDTDRMVAYREDGTLQNTAVTGDYEDMYLLPGQNAITLTEGFTLKVIPNWRRL